MLNRPEPSTTHDTPNTSSPHFTMSERKSTAAKVQDKVRQVAQEDLNQASNLANDAVRSGAYLYPFKVCQHADLHLDKD
jgi:hypothetical protein